MATTMTPEQAYQAMFLFLERYYEATGADDIGVLLGSMSLLEDGQPADPAMWADWCKAVEAQLAKDWVRGQVRP